MASIEVVGKYNAPLPLQRPGQHLWIVMAMFTVSPGDERFYLDGENLATIEGPGCYWCEEPHSAEIAAQFCLGHPS